MTTIRSLMPWVLSVTPSLIASPCFAESGQTSPSAETQAVDPEPSSGLGMMIPGWVLVGDGALNLALMPLCFVDLFGTSNIKGVCLGTSIGFGVVGFGVGIPLLVAGYRKRKRHQTWESNQLATHLERTQVTALPGGAAASYTFEF